MIYIAFLLFTFFILLFAFYQWQYFMIFRPTYIKERRLCQDCSLLSVITDDGVELEGAVYEPNNPTSTLLLFVGRSHDGVALLNRLSQVYAKSRVITWNYRGYGKSGGVINEKNILQDGLKIAELVQKNYGDFYLLGFSLGSSVAAYVAAKHKVSALFLVGAFDSIEELLRHKYAKISYMAKLLRYKFKTVEYVKNVDADTYLFVSRNDEIVSLQNARNLKKHIKNLVHYEEIDGVSHTELLWDPRVTNKINEVIA
ncbi:MAG TPA: alpha/beta hydrolase [Sulfurimonas autotrophica]|nr:alpha/beta hydrolase [Sulfurimonas autotrophica]